MGRKDFAEELIHKAAMNGADYVKFQLFPERAPFVSETNENVSLPYDLFPDLVRFGATVDCPVGASVFDQEALELCLSLPVPFVKFAYSQQHKTEWMEACKLRDKLVIVSSDMAGVHKLPKGVLPLYCVPEYPVPYQFNFSGLFNHGPFFGFSDHSMGIEEALKAVRFGARWVEKHFTLDRDDIECADHRFAIKPKQLKLMSDLIHDHVMDMWPADLQLNLSKRGQA